MHFFNDCTNMSFYVTLHGRDPTARIHAKLAYELDIGHDAYECCLISASYPNAFLTIRKTDSYFEYISPANNQVIRSELEDGVYDNEEAVKAVKQALRSGDRKHFTVATNAVTGISSFKCAEGLEIKLSPALQKLFGVERPVLSGTMTGLTDTQMKSRYFFLTTDFTEPEVINNTTDQLLSLVPGCNNTENFFKQGILKATTKYDCLNPSAPENLTH